MIRIDTPYPNPVETAKLLGLSENDVAQVRKLVDRLSIQEATERLGTAMSDLVAAGASYGAAMRTKFESRWETRKQRATQEARLHAAAMRYHEVLASVTILLA